MELMRLIGTELAAFDRLIASRLDAQMWTLSTLEHGMLRRGYLAQV